MIKLFKIIVFVVLVLSGVMAKAHQFSTANLTLNQQSETSHSGYISVSLLDLQNTLSIDPDNNGELTWSELQSAHPVIIKYLQSNMRFTTSSDACELSFEKTVVLTDSYGETLLKQPLSLECPPPISFEYQAFFDTATDHKLLVNWSLLEGQTQAILDKPTTGLSIESGQDSAWETFLFYLYQGMVHIWIGLDHVLFVITLLLHFFWKPTSSVVGEANASSSKLPLKSIFWLITGFTLAHSITLTLTALDWVSVSSKWAEVGIAISVAYSALNVVTHWIKRLMLMTTVFGLLHGLGFAGALSELGLSKSHQLTSIIGFNLGVEIGQIVIILAALPILWLLSQKDSVRKVSIPLVAISIFALGLLWVWQRI